MLIPALLLLIYSLSSNLFLSFVVPFLKKIVVRLFWDELAFVGYSYKWLLAEMFDF